VPSRVTTHRPSRNEVRLVFPGAKQGLRHRGFLYPQWLSFWHRADSAWFPKVAGVSGYVSSDLHVIVCPCAGERRGDNIGDVFFIIRTRSSADIAGSGVIWPFCERCCRIST
jgi:hypothetical protein